MKEIFDERARFRQSSVYTTFVPDRPIRLTQCCTQLKPFVYRETQCKISTEHARKVSQK